MAGCIALVLLGSLRDPARAAPAAAVLPPAELFRSLQLLTLACGRDNKEESCRQARDLADPLLDHPRLSSRCKDVLWNIRQQAQTAASNSLERREQIDRAARDVTVFCRPPVRSAPAPASNAGGRPAPGGAGGS